MGLDMTMEHRSIDDNREEIQENAEEEQEERDKKTQEEEDEKMQEKEDDTNQQSSANTNAFMTAKGRVTLATLEAELQCIICQYTMFKLLIPSVAERIQSYHQEEEQKFSSKLDQLDSKWKVFTLSERAAKYHGDEEQEHTRSSGRWEEDHRGNDEYPVLKVEDTRDGNLHVTRNIVLDTSDENEDGYVNMRVGIAIVEFPSIFELYNEHQECSVNVIKMEEDEEMADGMPFFMNDDGDDDGFVCGSYYNEISLHVCDEAGNCVMERTRGAQGGVVTFPCLRLDVPGGTKAFSVLQKRLIRLLSTFGATMGLCVVPHIGMYTFRFSDDLYGLKLSITTRLREPHEISDTPVADFVSLIHDEARDASRRNRVTHHDSDSERECDEEGDESDDSFIVDDCTGEEHNEQPIGRFSDGDSDDHGEYHSDKAAVDEKRGQLRARRRQRSSRRSEVDVPIVEERHDDDALSDEEGERSDGQENVDERGEDEKVDDVVRSRRHNMRVIEGLFSSDGETDQKQHDSVDAAKETETEEEPHDVVCPRQRNANQIVDSDDEDEGEGGPVESDEEQKADDDSGGVQSDADDERIEYSNDGASDSVAVEDHCSEEDDIVASTSTRKINRAQWFQDGESDEENKVDTADDVSERRPRKQSRKTRIIDEGESDKEEMERSIMSIDKEQANDDEDIDGMDGNDAQCEQVRFFDEEDEECNEFDDAVDEKDDAVDYPDDEEEKEEKEDENYW